MPLPSRHANLGSYRYGFQNQETDPEMLGGAVAFKYRVHDARIGRFLSVDPLAPEYPWNSPYAFSENDLIRAVEFEGLEKYLITWKDMGDGTTLIKVVYVQTNGTPVSETDFDLKNRDGVDVVPEGMDVYVRHRDVNNNLVKTEFRQSIMDHPYERRIAFGGINQNPGITPGTVITKEDETGKYSSGRLVMKFGLVIPATNTQNQTSKFDLGSTQRLSMPKINDFYDQITERLANGEVLQIINATTDEQGQILDNLISRGIENPSDSITFDTDSETSDLIILSFEVHETTETLQITR
jgi:RHS repeat-associated protein